MIENKNYKIHNNTEDLENLNLKGVYLIRNLDNNMLKIGIANNLSRRFKEIENSFRFCGVVPNLKIECFIEYEHNYELEQWLHKEFKEYNYQNEWFDIKDINLVIDKISECKLNSSKKYEYIELNNIRLNISKNKNDFTINFPSKILFDKEGASIYNIIKDEKIIKVIIELINSCNKRNISAISLNYLINNCGYSENDKNLKSFKNLLNKLDKNNVIKIINEYYRGNDLILIDINNLINDNDYINLSDNELNTINNISKDNREINTLLKLYIYLKITKNKNISYNTIKNDISITEPCKAINTLIENNIILINK